MTLVTLICLLSNLASRSVTRGALASKMLYDIWVKLRDAKISLSVTRDGKPTKGNKVSLSKKPVIQEGAEAECFPSAPSVGRAGPAGRNSTFGGRRLTKVLLRYFRRK